MNCAFSNTEDSMEGIGWLGAIIVGGIAGAIAGRFVSGHGYGIILDVIVGIIGGVVGGWLVTNLFHITGSGYIFSFIVSLIGAVILLMLLRLVTGNRARA
jgi:uncharacterized membrane protein YeaQ/YmgE (transglycosylase-associated protein family)